MKRLILLSDQGNFIEWGPGCFLQANSSPLYPGAGFAVVASSSTGQLGLRLGEFATEEHAKAVRALWLDAIICGYEGGLLRWDDERQEVVDELEEEIDAFFDDQMIPAPTTDTQSGPCASTGIDPIE